jgi:hypothetical protein
MKIPYYYHKEVLFPESYSPFYINKSIPSPCKKELKLFYNCIKNEENIFSCNELFQLLKKCQKQIL